MKRLLVFVSVICMLFSVSVFATETEGYTSGDYQYTFLEDGTTEITKYTGEEAELVIPGEMDGHTVTSIGEYAFHDCANLSSIMLPEGVTNIGNHAFWDCRSLSSIKLPEGVTCIGGSAFNGCAGLSSITLPEGLISIGDYAFSGCTSLSNITLPDSIETIGANPFAGDIISIIVSQDHPYLSVIDGVLFSKPDKKLLYFPDTKENYIVPDGIQSIGDGAFSACESLSSITLRDGVTSIGEYAFSGCYQLSSITLPEGLTSIGYGAFCDCEGLSSVTLPEDLTSIEYGAFDGCFNLTLTVYHDSYAVEYCKENGLNYTYPDANDWLNS